MLQGHVDIRAYLPLLLKEAKELYRKGGWIKIKQPYIFYQIDEAVAFIEVLSVVIDILCNDINLSGSPANQTFGFPQENFPGNAHVRTLDMRYGTKGATVGTAVGDLQEGVGQGLDLFPGNKTGNLHHGQAAWG